ncbi:MAG: four helix bundle protein [Bacteroidetes bacterium]|nr:four helix bundle protein [Bacteroidota bacterium]
MSYKDLEIWHIARDISIDIHRMSMELPSFEFSETGRQIRRSSKSVRSNIVEGYGRRVYKDEYIRFLIIAQASNDETRDHLETLYETGSLKDKEVHDKIVNKTILLGKKLTNYIKYLKSQRSKS